VAISLGSVTFNHVVQYNHINIVNIPTKKVAGKSTATVDTDTFVVMPKEIKLVVRLSAADKTTLEGYQQATRTLTDDDGAITVWVERVESEYKMGFNPPWMVTVSMKKTT